MTEQPTPQELTAIAAYLANVANDDMNTADPNSRTAFYARCVIHAAAMNLRAAAHRIDAPANMPSLAANSALGVNSADTWDLTDVEYVMACARRTITAEHTIVLGEN